MRYRSFVYDSDRWAAYRHRPGDIIISTPPKCGTTWTQYLVAMLVLGTTRPERPMAELSPWLDQLTRPIDEVVADLEAMAHRRFIKTHAPLDALPQHDDVTYVVTFRDPRDVAVSMDNHFRNLDLERMAALRAQAHGMHDVDEIPPMPAWADDPADRFWQYLTFRAPAPEFVGTFELFARHAEVAWPRRFDANVVLVHYADLQADLEGELRRIAKRLGIEVAEDRWAEMVEAASFASMRERASEVAPSAGKVWRDDRQFFNKGTSGQWRALVGEEADERYQALVRELIRDEELLSWLHRP